MHPVLIAGQRKHPGVSIFDTRTRGTEIIARVEQKFRARPTNFSILSRHVRLVIQRRNYRMRSWSRIRDTDKATNSLQKGNKFHSLKYLPDIDPRPIVNLPEFRNKLDALLFLRLGSTTN